MKLRVKTNLLKELVNKASKCSTQNKMIPLTSLMSIVADSGKISITTSDAVNFFTLSEDAEVLEPFSVVVNVELFSKLVAKTTSDIITLELNSTSLSFTGNGTYQIELPLNEEGSLIIFPPIPTVENSVKGTIKLAAVKSVILANKPALAVGMEAPHLTGYYCKEKKVISADSFNICINAVETFPESVLITPIVFDLLSMSDTEDIAYEYTNDVIIFTTPKMSLFSRNMKGIENYPVDAVESFEDAEFPSKCTLPKTALLNVLDRLALFINDYDTNGVYINFTNEGAKIVSTRNNATELIPYQGSENFAPFTCLVQIESLKKQISARTGEVVNIHYGQSGALKLVDNNVIQIIALINDEDSEE